MPGNKGKKVVKIDLFPATMFKDKCLPGSKWKVYPLVRFTSGLENLYRIKLNGKWYNKDGYHYYFLTKDEVYEVLKNG